jgi:hypothetical protein
MNAVTTTTTPLGYADIERLAASIAQSGLFGIKTKDQAIALMMIAHAEGRHPALAARDYDVISGRPAKKAEAMLRDFLEAGGKTQWHALSDEIADATFSHPSGGSVRIMWNMERAAKAGLGGKDNWKKFPRQMLRSRTVSEGVRTVWPMATSGMHVPEETVDFAGTTLDAEPEAPPLRAAAAPMARADRIAEKAPAYEAPPPPPRQTIGQFLDALELAMRDCDTLGAVNRLIASPKVVQAQQSLKNGALERLEAIIAAGVAAHAPVTYPTTDDGDAASEDLEEVQIAGAEKLAAG